MAANPPLVTGWGGATIPAPYAEEQIILARPGVELVIEGSADVGGRWRAKGTAFLTNMRMVFVADNANHAALRAYELPLAYLSDYSFKQPILRCNHLRGGRRSRGRPRPPSLAAYPRSPACVPAQMPSAAVPPCKRAPSRTPSVAASPHARAGKCRAVQPGPTGQYETLTWALYFVNGGVGIFVPIFVRTTEYIRRTMPDASAGDAAPASTGAAGPSPPGPLPPPEQLQTAYVDPNDPTKIYLTSPVDESQRLHGRPGFSGPLV